MGLIHFATDDTRHEIVLPSHRITAADPCPSDDEHALIVIDSGQKYRVRESLESVAAKLHTHGVSTYRVGSIGREPVPVATEQDAKQPEPAEAQPEPPATEKQNLARNGKASKQVTATPEAQPAADGVASQASEAGTES